ncbi:MAG: hypothetical protein ORO03_03710 [Alphaproteobacteria bacterium]|nr:hypothetical protein [Alphaproteobacteria bacterium]
MRKLIVHLDSPLRGTAAAGAWSGFWLWIFLSAARAATPLQAAEFDHKTAVILFHELRHHQNWQSSQTPSIQKKITLAQTPPGTENSPVIDLQTRGDVIPRMSQGWAASAADSLLLNPKIPQLAGIWTSDDIFDPPQHLLVTEFGGHVIATSTASNSIAANPLNRSAQSLGMAPDWYGSGVTFSGSTGNLLHNGRNVRLMNIGLSFDRNKEDLKTFAPFVGISSSIAVSYDSDPPSTMQPTNILVRTMVGVISHLETSSGEWIQLRLAYARDINDTKPYEAYFPSFKFNQPRSNGMVIDLDAGLRLSQTIMGGAINPHISYDTLGGSRVLQNIRNSNRTFMINIRWRL